MDGKPTVILDNSVLSRLPEDNDSKFLVSELISGFRVLLSAISVEEIVATTDSALRRKLLNVCAGLLPEGGCLWPQNAIVEALVRHHASGSRLDWRAVCVRCPEYEQLIARPQFASDGLAAKQRDYAGKVGNKFGETFEKVRPRFQKLLRKHGEAPPTIPEFIAALRVSGGAFWSAGIGLYRRGTGKSLDEPAIREFIDHCPPFHAFGMTFAENS
jgi:hypothetical protein